MRAVAMLLVVLAAPEPVVSIAYRFEKGMAYEDRSVHSFTLELIQGEKLLRFVAETRQTLTRTVVEVDDQGLPLAERIQVTQFETEKKEWPDAEPGVTRQPSSGRTFVWRKKRDSEGWGLFDGEGEVGAKFPRLVERLHNWRDARLPAEPVAPGSTWEVSTARFLATVGQAVPENLEGKAVFTLEGVEDGVATIGFRATREHKDEDHVLTGTQKGTWRFDVAKGRDLDLEMTGELRVDNGRGGVGTFRMKRTLTYGGSSRPTPRDS